MTVQLSDDMRARLADFANRGRRWSTGFEHEFCPHAPSPKQKAFIDYDGAEALYGGAAGGGKSDGLLASAIKYVHVPGYAALLLRRTFADLALPQALMARAHEWFDGTAARWNDTAKRWRFPSGATLTFGYLENERDVGRYQSAEFQFIGFDELTQFTERQYTYLFSRLRRTTKSVVPLRCRAATNPGGGGHKWVKERWSIPDDVDFEKTYENKTGAKFFPAKLEDNPHTDKATYEESLSKLTRSDYEQLRNGRWVQDASMLVYEYDSRRDLVVALPKLSYNNRWSRILAIDYGNVDATALVQWAYCTAHSDVAYVEKSQKWTKLDPDGAAEIVRQWGLDCGGYDRIVGDVGGLGKGYAEQARQRWGIPIEPAEKSDKIGTIKLLNGAAQHGRVQIVRDANQELIEEIEAHQWHDETKTKEKQSSQNHLLDARLYGWRETQAWMHQAKIEDRRTQMQRAEDEEREQERMEAEQAMAEDQENRW